MITTDSLRCHLGYNVKRAWDVMRADLSESLRPFELRIVTFSCLAITIENPGLRPSQLAEALAIERANLVVILGELEERGLIERKPSETDRRSHALSATPQGRMLFEKAQAAAMAHNDRMVSPVDPGVLKPLQEALRAIGRLKP